MHWLLLLSLVVGEPAPPDLLPGFLDAAKLMTFCQAEGPDARAGRALCMGYVVGAVDQLVAQQARREEGRRTICAPRNMTANDAVNAVIKYSRFAVTANGVGASSFVRFAMEETYRCPVRGIGR